MSNVQQKPPPARKRRAWLPWVITGGVAMALLLAVLSWALFAAGWGSPGMESRRAVGSTATADVPDTWAVDHGDGSRTTVGGHELVDRQVFVHADEGLDGAIAVYSSIRLTTEAERGDLVAVVKAMIADQIEYPVRNSIIPIKQWNPGCVEPADYAMLPRQQEVAGGVLQLDVAYSCANMHGRSIAVTRVLTDQDFTIHCLTVVTDTTFGKRHKDLLKLITDSFHIIPESNR